MKDKHKESAIQTAIQEYKLSVSFGFSSRTVAAINTMENVYIMCAPYNIDGIAVLGETINKAKDQYKGRLSITNM